MEDYLLGASRLGLDEALGIISGKRHAHTHCSTHCCCHIFIGILLRHVLIGRFIMLLISTIIGTRRLIALVIDINLLILLLLISISRIEIL
jgi:hypothetical protein